MVNRFRNRAEAGVLLAEKLGKYAERPDVLILALPRGGVLIGFEVAQALHAPLDIVLVRKLGVPGEEELAMGALASGGVRVLNREIVEALSISESEIEAVATAEQQELERRERLYRGTRLPPKIRGRVVILVDDGIATGATMRVALAALRKQQPARLIVAVPVAPLSTVQEFRAEREEVVCVRAVEPFDAIGCWYDDFRQISDHEVCDLLERASHEWAPAHKE